MSKGLLEAFQDLTCNYPEDYVESYNKVLNGIKALEIIKEKKVNLEFLKCSENYEQYCLICSYGNEISKEEYDLLKEVLL